MKLTKQKLRQLIVEAMNFDSNTGDPLTPEGFKRFKKMGPGEAKNAELNVRNGIKMVQETIKKSHGSKAASVFGHALVAALSGRGFTSNNANEAQFELYKLGAAQELEKLSSIQSTTAPTITKSKEEKNKRLQKMIDMMDPDDPNAEFFKKQMK